MFRKIAVAVLAALAVTAGSAYVVAESFNEPTAEVAKLGTTFYVADPVGRDTVTFKSEAPLENMIGTSNRITGYIVFDPAKKDFALNGAFSVPIEKITTGIKMRDEHMAGAAWLDAAKFPDITFVIESTKGAKELKKGEGFVTYDVTLVGKFTLKGTSKQIEVPARVTYLKANEKTKARLPGDIVAVRASFAIKLKDFNIEGTPAAVGKVADEVTIDVNVMGTSIKVGAK